MEITIRTPEGEQVAHITSLGALIWMWLHTEFPEMEASYLEKFEVEVSAEETIVGTTKLTMSEMLKGTFVHPSWKT